MARATTGTEFLGTDGAAAQREDTVFRLTRGKRIIGVRKPKLIHKSTTAGDALSELTQTKTFHRDNDWADLRPDAARIELVNNDGSSRTLTDVAVYGFPVTMQMGEASGFIHDELVDWNDIEERGPIVHKFGSEDVITKTQLEKLADYWWKYNRSQKHIYQATMTGMIQWLQPGDWYTLKVGQSGVAENIDATVEVLNVRQLRRPGEIGETSVTFREIESAWKNDSSAVARFIASGGTTNLFANKMNIIVASQFYAGNADVYCDGTADDVEINQAILAASYAGGAVVTLTEGTFTIAASIALKANVTLEGQGRGTIISKNFNDHGIDIASVDGCIVRNLSATGADSNANALVRFSAANNCVASGLYLYDYTNGLSAEGSSANLVVENSTAYQCTSKGFAFSNVPGLQLTNVIVDGNSQVQAASVLGVSLVGCDNANLTNVTIQNLSCSSFPVKGLNVDANSDDNRFENIAVLNIDCTVSSVIQPTGVWMAGDRNIMNDIEIIDIDNTNTASHSRGIYILGDDCIFTGLLVEGCSGTGIHIPSGDGNVLSGYRSTNNGTNYTNAGTNTTVAAGYTA